MTFSPAYVSFVLAWVLLLSDCAVRRVNPPIAKYDPQGHPRKKAKIVSLRRNECGM